MAKKKKKTKEEEDKGRAKLLGKGLARRVAEAMLSRRKKTDKLLKSIK